MSAAPSGESLPPRSLIRRFDVFAEYNRVKNQQKGMPEDQAKGYALWLAKLVAARKFATSPEAREAVNRALGKGRRPPEEREEVGVAPRYRALNGIAQTGELFDREIVERMGPTFYSQVFAPAIAEAIAEHQSYEAIRDRLRVPWNLRRMSA